MGGAQPLAVTMNDGVAICIECDQHRIDRRLETRYLDVQARDLDHALELALEARAERRGLSIGLLGNAAEVLPEILERHLERQEQGDGPLVDIVTDQTSAHDPLFYLPAGTSYDDWERERTEDPRGFTKRSQESMARHVRAMVELQDAGAEVFDYGNSIRDEARKGGYDRAFEFPGFVPAYIRPLFCEGKGPFRWAALSGDPEDIYATDRAIKELFPADEKPEYARLHAWLDMASERVQFQGLPARICWLGYGDRAKAGAKFNEMVASGELQGADRDRPRPPRLRLGRLALPRDRGDARRVRRHRRLGDPQRIGQHRVGCHLGLLPPRRRRRHRPLAPRRPGHRRRRH